MIFFFFSSCFVSTDPSSVTSLLIKFFLFWCLAKEWNMAALASPSLSHKMRDLLRAIVRCSEERASEWSLSLFGNQVSKFDRVQWSWAISNWCRTSIARPNWVFTCPTFFWLQLWSALIVALNLFASVERAGGSLNRGPSRLNCLLKTVKSGLERFKVKTSFSWLHII